MRMIKSFRVRCQKWLMFFLVCILMYWIINMFDQGRKLTEVLQKYEIYRESDLNRIQLENIHHRRRDKLRKACAGNEFRFIGTSPEHDVRNHFVYDNNSKLLFCAMEKVGSTFWRRLFQILAGKANVDSPFDIRPEHALRGNIKKFPGLPFYSIISMLTIFRKFVFVRDPFARLYSGYIDKIFSPNPVYWNKIGTFIAKNQRKKASNMSKRCGHDITFKEFVHFYIYSETNNKLRDGHFIPMFDHCKPCQVQYDYIGKMETFENDTLFLLDIFNFTNVRKTLETEFSAATIKDSFTDQTKILFRHSRSLEKCLSMHEQQKRFWKKHQIRGLIDSSAIFPFPKEHSTELTVEKYVKALHNAVGRTHSRDVSERQRKEFMMEAYSTVPDSDLLLLQEIFKPDCEIFEYDCDVRKFIKH